MIVLSSVGPGVMVYEYIVIMPCGSGISTELVMN